MNPLILVIDTETTGTNDDPTIDKVIELAGVPVIREGAGGPWKVGRGYDCFVNPERLIPPEASAVHHIRDGHVHFSPTLEPTTRHMRKQVCLNVSSNNIIANAAHNAPFDAKFFPQLVEPWIDTYRCALHLFPDMPNFKNQTLRYCLDLDPAYLLPPITENPRAHLPHSALYDTYCTALVLVEMLKLAEPAALIELSTKPVILKKMPFGVHFGKPFQEVPVGYMKWCLLQQKMNSDVLHTCRHHLGM